ncbi:MmgE/PrpD family protein [Paractinoplanes atraurantiacus]|uniref:2-methylcitrate dehydratase PrpD n=1 Tax=Paractinoplanes atraurantiacus TaxID=1036182 RepID=A0A285K2F9_9ACTN|nr:MmgE/PrpD family protein [Actinoplanes atraurantiacus]SNY66760.1 2-methylcitrate dehydratase PrpD [Actinoplanes atraurantiacus]
MTSAAGPGRPEGKRIDPPGKKRAVSPDGEGAGGRTGEPAAVILGRWSAELTPGDIPGQVAGAARRHLIDAVGCAVAGVRRGAAGPALAVAAGLGGPPEARLFSGERLGAVAAAFGNAVAIHALDFDDTHPGGLVHPSAVTVPVALALGEQTGGDHLTALVAGLETACRLGAAVPHGFHARGLHATSMVGPVAAAVTAGKLLRLDAPTLTHAIGIAASGAGGLLEFLHSPAGTKQIHPGTAVANGILAARLAAAGATGPAGALDGEYGLFRALTGRSPDRDVLTGDGWEIPLITIKPYPACQLVHPSVDAARQFAGVRPRALTVTLHPDAVPIVAGEAKRRPRSAYEAKFSVYWCVAAMIVDGHLGLDSFDRLDRADLLDLAARIDVVEKDFGTVAADAPGIVAFGQHVSHVDTTAGPGFEAKAQANLGPGAAAVFAAATPAEILDATERCLW